MIVPQGYLTPAQAGERLGVSASTVRRLVREGELRAVVPRGRQRGMLIPESELARWCWESLRDWA